MFIFIIYKPTVVNSSCDYDESILLNLVWLFGISVIGSLQFFVCVVTSYMG